MRRKPKKTLQDIASSDLNPHVCKALKHFADQHPDAVMHMELSGHETVMVDGAPQQVEFKQVRYDPDTRLFKVQVYTDHHRALESAGISIDF